MKILFSPIGNTDPMSVKKNKDTKEIEKANDGSMIHICRKYKPDKVYMYFSAEIKEDEEKDNRHTKSIDLIGKKLGKKIDYEIINGDKVDDVHRFDPYYTEFDKELKEIAEKNPMAEIILNTSSGTPGMKAALQVIAAFDETGRYKAVQVASPEDSRKKDETKRKIDEEWEKNEDNLEDYKDRSEESSHSNLITKFKKEMIKKHIETYDYHAAFEIAKDIKKNLKEKNDLPEYILSDKAMYAIEGAKERLALNYNKYVELFIKSDVDEKEFNLKKNVDDMTALYEYILSLEIKLKKEEYADFVRAISPILKDVFKMYIEKELNIDIMKYCSDNKNNPRLERRKLEDISNDNNSQYNNEARRILQALDSEFIEKNKKRKNNKNNKEKKYMTSSLAASNLGPLVKRMSSDSAVIKYATTLLNLEEGVRNIAAHQVVSISAKYIKEKSGVEPFEAMKCLKKLAEKIGITKSNEWESYKVMNNYIKEVL